MTKKVNIGLMSLGELAVRVDKVSPSHQTGIFRGQTLSWVTSQNCIRTFPQPSHMSMRIFATEISPKLPFY